MNYDRILLWHWYISILHNCTTNTTYMLFLTHNIARQLPNLREKLRFLQGLKRSLLWRTSAPTNRHHTTKNPLGWELKHTSKSSCALPKIISGGHSLPEISTFISTLQWLKKFSCGHVFFCFFVCIPCSPYLVYHKTHCALVLPSEAGTRRWQERQLSLLSATAFG